jgi:hypothetical protein
LDTDLGGAGGGARLLELTGAYLSAPRGVESSIQAPPRGMPNSAHLPNSALLPNSARLPNSAPTLSTPRGVVMGVASSPSWGEYVCVPRGCGEKTNRPPAAAAARAAATPADGVRCNDGGT